MHYAIAEICTPVFIEQMKEYAIKYDDFMFYSVWHGDRCLLENATLAESREFCQSRIEKNGELAFVYDTYFLLIRGHCYSKTVGQDSWKRRYHKPWIGFYPALQKIGTDTDNYEGLYDDFLAHETAGRISPFYATYLTPKDRLRYNSV